MCTPRDLQSRRRRRRRLTFTLAVRLRSNTLMATIFGSAAGVLNLSARWGFALWLVSFGLGLAMVLHKASQRWNLYFSSLTGLVTDSLFQDLFVRIASRTEAATPRPANRTSPSRICCASRPTCCSGRCFKTSRTCSAEADERARACLARACVPWW